MQSTKNLRAKARLVARHRQAIAAGNCDFQMYSDGDLARVHAELVSDLTTCEGFGLIASVGVRQHCLHQLVGVGDELARRAVAVSHDPHALPRQAA